MRAINSPGRAGPALTDPEAPSSRKATLHILVSPVNLPDFWTEGVQQGRKTDKQPALMTENGYAVLVGGQKRLIRQGLTCCDRRCRAQSTSGCVAHHVGNRSHVCTRTVHVPVAPRRSHKERTVARCNAARCDAMR